MWSGRAYDFTNFKLTFTHQPLEDFGRLRLPSPSPAATQVLNCSFRERDSAARCAGFLACLLRSWSRPWSPFRSGGGCSSLSGDLRSLFLRPREAVSHGLGLSVARDERVVIPVPPQRSWSLLPGNSVDFLFIHKLPRISLDILTYWSFKNVPWLALEPFDLGVS